MKIYLAGGENYTKAIKKAGAKRVLFSYYYLPKNKDLISDFDGDVFLDSGGFTASTKNTIINIDDYINFIKKNEKHLTVYAVLDVIGNFRETMRNQRIMEGAGLKPLPVFHYGEDFKYLEELVEEYDYIAIGGMVPIARNKPKLFGFLDYCFKIARRKKLHGFGMTGVELMHRYPFYSVDSTSWLNGGKHSEVHIFSKGNLEMIKTKNKTKANNYTMSLADIDGKKYYDRAAFNVTQWIKFEKYITDLWAKRGIIWND